ncbi:hypothetical protein G033_01030 [Pectobacterium peruviense]|nr:hypothetical protein G033_01030 [Pectobacterium peruviense]
MKAVSNDLTLKRISIVYAARATEEVALLFNNIIRQSVWALTRPYLNDIKSLEDALLFNNIIRQSVWALTRPYLNDIKSLEE